jgi:putative hydrolase of the HAD superfamily
VGSHVRLESFGGPGTITLDALGTLVELEPPAPHLARALGVPLEAAERAIVAEIAYYRAHLDEGRDGTSVEDLRRRCARVLAAELSVTADLTDVLLASLRFNVFEEVPATLRALRDRGTRLVIVSNWDVSLHDVLERLELKPLLDAIVTSAEAGVRKPAPEIFARVGVTPAIHVGDSVKEDVAGARAAGIEPVLIRRDGGAGPPGVRTISSLAELLQPWDCLDPGVV